MLSSSRAEQKRQLHCVVFLEHYFLTSLPRYRRRDVAMMASVKKKNNIFGRLLVQTNSKQQFVELYIEMTNCRYIFASVYYKVKYFHYLPPLSTALTDASAVSDSWLSCCFKL